MLDNPQQNVKNTSKKLRPIKLSDEAFELFYKEIYAEFGPKDVPPVELNPKKEIQTAEEIIVPDVVEAPEQTVAEPEMKEPVSNIPAADNSLQEEIAQAAAMIRDVQGDQIIDENTEGVTLVKTKKEKGLGGLIVTICLELLAIAGIVGYWLLYIL